MVIYPNTPRLTARTELRVALPRVPVNLRSKCAQNPAVICTGLLLNPISGLQTHTHTCICIYIYIYTYTLCKNRSYLPQGSQVRLPNLSKPTPPSLAGPPRSYLRPIVGPLICNPHIPTIYQSYFLYQLGSISLSPYHYKPTSTRKKRVRAQIRAHTWNLGIQAQL